MLRTHLDHRVQNRIPGGRILQRRIGEHAAVPANMTDATLGCPLQPIPGTLDDVQLSIRIIRRAMLARLVM